MANEPVQDPTGTEIPEDPFITETLSNLAEIRVPSEFLPNVMFQVYERHHRDRLKWPQVLIISVVLFVLSAVFFTLDVVDFMNHNNITQFSTALDTRLDGVMNRFELFLATAGSVFTAGWQLLRGLFSETPIVIQLGILVGLVAMVWLIKKAMAQLVP